MAAETTTTLDGQFKRRYADRMEDLVPDHADFAEAIPFTAKPKLGASFEFPARVRRAQGYTFSAAGTMYQLNSAVPGLTTPARVTMSSYTMREQIAYDAAAAGIGNDDAFGDIFDVVVTDMINTMGLHREIAILYGQTDIGLVTGAGSSSTSKAYTLTNPTSAIGLWLQLEGAPVDVYDPTYANKRNSTGDLTVSAVALNADGQRVDITLTGAAADNNAVQAGDAIVPKGWVGGSMAGVDKVCTNTGSLFGINAGTYSLWKANMLSAGSAEMTMLMATRLASIQVQRSGLKGKRLKMFYSFPTWNDLNNNHAALRRFAQSTKSGLDLGAMDSITYYGPGVAIDISPSGIVKNGEAFLGEWNTVKRVGASDLSFTLPGSSPGEEKFFMQVPDYAGYELRGYWQQCIIPQRPAALSKMTGIINSI